MELTRRQAVAAGCFGLAGLSAASALTATPAIADNGTDYASQVADVQDCDIAVVGAGASGLVAAVEALLGGARVVVLEKLEVAGGSGGITECIMGVGTPAQKEGRITAEHPSSWQALVLNPERPTKTDITYGDIIATEMNMFNGEVDGERWHAMVSNSVKNIDWLTEQGVAIEDACDNYQGEGHWNTAHWWANGGIEGFVDPMVARIEELGGTVLYETPACQLIMDNGSVAGVYAEGPDGVVQVNAKAVILASGGFGENKEMLEAIGCGDVVMKARPGHNGDGISMALEVGAKSWIDQACLMMWPFILETGDFSYSSTWCSIPSSLWVNGNGARFVDENFASHIPDRGAHCLRTQDRTFAIMDDKTVEYLKSLRDDLSDYVDESLANSYVRTANSVEELAEAIEVDPEILAKTIEDYNTNCENGIDADFGKDPSCLVRLDAPFYFCNNHSAYQITSLGGLDTTAQTEVRDESGEIIKGLFAVGADGTQLWKGLYTISAPGACNANNVYTGRVAAQKALELL